MHTKRCFKEFEIKKLGEYHDLNLKSDVLFSSDVFDDFKKFCLKTYELDPARFISAPGLAWQASLKKTEVKLPLLNDIYILLMVGKGIKGGLYQPIQRDVLGCILQYWDMNNLYGWNQLLLNYLFGFQ